MTQPDPWENATPPPEPEPEPWTRTGFPPEVRDAIINRSRGQCECCRRNPASEIHHRQPRGMGGASGERDLLVNAIPNGVALCRDCHHKAETQRVWGKERGLLVARHETPADVPVWMSTVMGWKPVWLGVRGECWFSETSRDLG